MGAVAECVCSQGLTRVQWTPQKASMPRTGRGKRAAMRPCIACIAWRCVPKRNSSVRVTSPSGRSSGRGSPEPPPGRATPRKSASMWKTDLDSGFLMTPKTTVAWITWCASPPASTATSSPLVAAHCVPQAPPRLGGRAWLCRNWWRNIQIWSWTRARCATGTGQGQTPSPRSTLQSPVLQSAVLRQGTGGASSPPPPPK